MSITPVALLIERFRSFRGLQQFNFPMKPGLYQMLGKNEVEPALGGNGAGKSSIWAALTWLLYERTPDGLKAGDVCNWEETKGTSVAFVFLRDGGIPCRCMRTWSPNTWTLDDDGEKHDLAKDPSNLVLAALRLEFDPFLTAILTAQDGDYFLDMERGRQASLFASVMNLEEWELRAARADLAAKEQDRSNRTRESDTARLRGQLDALLRQQDNDDSERWERQRKERLTRLNADYDDLLAQRKGLQKVLDAAQERAERERKALASLPKIAALDDEYDLVCANVRRHEDKLLKLAVEVEALQSVNTKLQKDAGKCPTCGKPWATHDWQQESKRTERQAEALLAEVKNIDHTMNIARRRRDILEVDINKHADQENALRIAEGEVNSATNMLELCEKRLDDIEDMHDEVEHEANPFAESTRQLDADIRKARTSLRNAEYMLDEGIAQHALKSLWVRGFREIRLREIASALAELEVEVNSCVMALGLQDWQLEFRVDRETKGGSIQRGFSTLVRSPDARNKAVPWKAWSGGEKQRLRIAANAGLGDLVRARTGCELPLEVWDEPTNGLSPEGKLDLFRYLADRARDESRIIFLADHEAHDFGGFAGTCTIIKTRGGSRIRTSW